MDNILTVLFFVFGTIIGSFLNVVICRYNTGATVMGRSMCLSCGSSLTWKNLIPIISFLLQRGKCPYCASAVSWQYPIVEVVVAVLFVMTYMVFGVSWYSVYLLLQVSILTVIGVYDYKHKIIPNEFVYLFSLLSLGYVAVAYAVGILGGDVFWRVLAGPLLALPFALLFWVSKGRWMGFGDAKLALGIGWFLGLERGYIAIALSFWIGATVSILLIALGRIRILSSFMKHVTMKSEIPFGPFMIVGTLIGLYSAPNIDMLMSFLF